MSEGARPAWHALEARDVLARLETPHEGLEPDEARRRLASHGPNTLRRAQRSSAWRIAGHQFTGALTYVLMAALLISLAIGHWEDAVVIGIVLVVNAVIGFFQEYRAENAIAALMSLVSPRATVRRGGQRVDVPSSEIVPGDLVLLESGALIPADLRLVEQVALEVDEALLTGESVTVPKVAGVLPGDGAVPVAERRNMVFMGTTVAAGRARGVAVATAADTELGAIAAEIRTTERARTPLQERMRRFGRRISLAVVAASALTFTIGWARGEAAADMFLTAVAIAVSAVPEGLPVAMTIALAVSVRRMARRQALVRRLPAVETLGSCTVIVTDKTGTLTRNEMTVQEIVSAEGRIQVTGSGVDPQGAFVRDGEEVEAIPGSALHGTLVASALCNEADLRQRAEGGFETSGDPTEVALLVAAAKAGLQRESLLDAHPEEASLPFESERQYAATLRRSEAGPLLLVKGAPERIVEMCAARLGPTGLEPLDAEAAHAEADRMAGEGLRVLGVAFGVGPGVTGAVAGEAPRGLVLLGLVGMLDPPREGVRAALAECRTAGIRVLMVTGDHARTAQAIAERIGLAAEGGRVLGGAALASLSDEELGAALAETRVFARVSPAQKLRIVQVLVRRGEVVAVTGDGVNDAPALKAAHVGAAMGLRGTDVAKEASEIVLADDDFATISAAVQEGRVAFSNLRKATFFLVSSGVGELLAILASLVLRLPLPLLPAQILWLNVVTNGVEHVGLVMEPGEPEEFRRAPRDPREGILSRALLERVLLSGAVMAAGTIVIFFGEWNGDPERLVQARVAALTSLVVFQIFHVGNCRSEYRSVFAKSPFSNRFLLLGVAASAGLHVAALYLPFTQRLLRVQPLPLESWLRIFAVGLTIVLVVELHKRLRPPPDDAQLSPDVALPLSGDAHSPEGG